jgi:hypothetical protein
MSDFRDQAGRLIGFTRENLRGSGSESVFDGRGAFVGSIDSNTTRTADGKLASTGRNPGALFLPGKP